MRLHSILRGIFNWVTVLSMLPIMVAVLCSGYITYRYNVVLNETRSLVRQSLKVTTSIADLMLDLQDLETGQRGYLITGDQAYLAPFEAARDRFKGDLVELLKLVGDNETQTDSAKRIAGLVRDKLDELEQTIRVRRDDGFDAARAIVANGTGKVTMDRIRILVDTMRAREGEMLTANTGQMRRSENRVIVVVGITILLSLIGRLAALLLPIWWRSRSKSHDGNDTA